MSEISPWWVADWVCSIPIILLTVLFHATGLVLVEEMAVNRLERILRGRVFRVRFAVIVGTTGLLVTVLHGIEAAIWAAVYLMLGALPTERLATLYSLNAITSFGHIDFHLEQEWELMGALEALNGLMLFGLTTAFLFSVVQGALSPRRARRAVVGPSSRSPRKSQISDMANESATASGRGERETV